MTFDIYCIFAGIAIDTRIELRSDCVRKTGNLRDLNTSMATRDLNELQFELESLLEPGWENMLCQSEAKRKDNRDSVEHGGPRLRHFG